MPEEEVDEVEAIEVEPSGESFLVAYTFFDEKQRRELGAIRRYSLTNFEELEAAVFPTAVQCLRYTPDGSRLAAGFQDGSIRWLEKEQFRSDSSALRVPDGSAVSFLSFSPDGEMLAAVGKGPDQICVFDSKSGRILGSSALSNYGTASPVALCFEQTRGTLLWGGDLGGVFRWDVQKMGAATELSGTELADGIGLLVDGRLVWRDVSPGDQVWVSRAPFYSSLLTMKLESLPKPIRLFDIGTGKPAGVWSGGKPFRAHHVSRNGQYLVALDESRSLSLWRTSNQILLSQVEPETEDGLVGCFGLNVSENGLYVAWSQQYLEEPERHRPYIWNTETGVVHILEDCRRQYLSWYSPDHQYLLSYQGDFAGNYGLSIRNAAAPFEMVRFSEYGFGSVAFFAHSDRVIRSLTYSAFVGAVDGRTRESGTFWTPNSFGVVALHPSEKRVFSGGSDGRIRIWDLTSRQLRAVLPEQEGAIKVLLADPNGKWLLSKANSGPMKFWWFADDEDVTLHPGFSEDSLSGLVRTKHYDAALRLLPRLGSETNPLVNSWWTEAIIACARGDEARFDKLRRDLLIEGSNSMTRGHQVRLALLCSIAPADPAVYKAGVRLAEQALKGAYDSTWANVILALGKVRLGAIQEAKEVLGLDSGTIEWGAGDSTIAGMTAAMIYFHEGLLEKAQRTLSEIRTLILEQREARDSNEEAGEGGLPAPLEDLLLREVELLIEGAVSVE